MCEYCIWYTPIGDTGYCDCPRVMKKAACSVAIEKKMKEEKKDNEVNNKHES